MGQQSSIAIIVPALGGGTVRHAVEMARAWSQQGNWVLWLTPSGRLIDVSIMKDGKTYRSYTFFLSGNEDTLLKLMRTMQIKAIHYHHFIHVEKFLLTLPQILNIPFYVTLHDYFTVCPAVNLVRENGAYCGEKGIEQCNQCLRASCKSTHSHIRDWPMDIDRWRNEWHDFLVRAATVFVPQNDVKRRIVKYFPDIDMHIFENPEIIVPANISELLSLQTQHIPQNIRRIGIVGTITPIKGAEVVVACARKAIADTLPVQFVLFGDLQFVTTEKIPDNLTILGAYQEADIYKQIVEQSIDFFWFPCILPETYSYTLSIPIRLHIPVIGAAIGAVGDRIERHHWGDIYPVCIDVEDLCHKLLSFDFQYYANNSNEYQLENTTFPTLGQLYNDLNENNLIEVSLRACFTLCDEIENKSAQIRMSNIIGIEYKAIFRQKKSWSWKLRTLLYVDYHWLKRFICYTDKKILWNKVKRMIIG